MCRSVMYAPCYRLDGQSQKKNRTSEYYDTTDPFIDDSELAQDERTFFAQTKQKGFYVSSGQVALLNTYVRRTAVSFVKLTVLIAALRRRRNPSQRRLSLRPLLLLPLPFLRARSLPPLLCLYPSPSCRDHPNHQHRQRRSRWRTGRATSRSRYLRITRRHHRRVSSVRLKSLARRVYSRARKTAQRNDERHAKL